MADTWPVNNGVLGTKGSGSKLSSRFDSKGFTPSQISSKIPAGTVATVGYGVGQVDPRLAKAAGAKEVPPVSNPTQYIEGIGWGTGSGATTKAVSDIKKASAASSASNAANGGTYSGTAPAGNPEPFRTYVIDPNKSFVEQIIDTFLQGLGGGLSNALGAGLSGMLGNLPGAVKDLLNSTGLTGMLGEALGKVDAAIGQAMGKLSGALGDAANKLVGGLGTAIAQIPGVGPVFEKFGKGVNSFTNNLQTAIGGLPTDIQPIVSNAVASVGANVIGKITGNPKISNVVGTTIFNKLQFNQNPITQLNNVASVAKNINLKTFKFTKDNVFQGLASAATKTAKKLSKKMIKNAVDKFSFSKLNIPTEPIIKNVTNGIVSTTNVKQASRAISRISSSIGNFF